jgi:hypothetical protein
MNKAWTEMRKTDLDPEITRKSRQLMNKIRGKT